jgi:D-threo-aldose 1-dehydrogenase
MCERLAQLGDFDLFLMAGRYTLLEQESLESFLPLCQKKKIGVICGGPYNSGILATGAKPGATYNYEAAPANILEKVRKIEKICEAHQVSLSAAAIQFPLFHDAVLCVIPGGKTPEEVTLNATQLEIPIPNALWSDLKQAGLIVVHAPTP